MFAFASVVLLLIATSVQAAHFCDLGGGASQQQVKANTTAANGALGCVICAGAHGAPLAAVIPALTPEMVPPDSVRALVSRTAHFLSGFALHVRPPPAHS